MSHHINSPLNAIPVQSIQFTDKLALLVVRNLQSGEKHQVSFLIPKGSHLESMTILPVTVTKTTDDYQIIQSTNT